MINFFVVLPGIRLITIILKGPRILNIQTRGIRVNPEALDRSDPVFGCVHIFIHSATCWHSLIVVAGQCGTIKTQRDEEGVGRVF